MIPTIHDLKDLKSYYRIPILNYKPLKEQLNISNLEKYKWLCSNSKFCNSESILLGFNLRREQIIEGIENGALVIHNQKDLKGGTFVRLRNLSVAEIKHSTVNYPSLKFKIYGITGTKGKTTTAWFAYQMLQKIGLKPAYIGTLGLFFGSHHVRTLNTTPSLDFILNCLLLLQSLGCKSIVCECSSIGLEQGRVDGIDFDGVFFTGFGHDHLDYHKDLKNYFAAKKKLFSLLEKSRKSKKIGVVIGNSTWSNRIFNQFKDKFLCFKINSQKLKLISLKLKSSEFEYEGTVFKVKFFFKPFFLYVVGLVKLFEKHLGISIDKLIINTLKLPPGRFELISDFVFVDYAHTPESLESAILAIKSVSQKHLTVVFGCGGNRDPSKRPAMGRVASELADYVILTNDNPRNEEPVKIVEDIVSGIQKDNFMVILNRRKAIQRGLKLALKLKGNLLVAGKGHETEQIVGNRKFNFDDRLVVKQALQKLNDSLHT